MHVGISGCVLCVGLVFAGLGAGTALIPLGSGWGLCLALLCRVAGIRPTIWPCTARLLVVALFFMHSVGAGDGCLYSINPAAVGDQVCPEQGRLQSTLLPHNLPVQL
jgi:hypothetical protein